MSQQKNSTVIALLTMIPVWIVAIIISLSLSECIGKEENYTPRRTAYPRIALCDTVYSATSMLPLNFEVNARAEAVRDTARDADDGSQWVNIDYPSYNATVYCTYTPVGPATIGRVIDNRIERISLNIGSATSEMTEFATANDVSAKVIYTPDGTMTPLQFIATDNRSWVLSGALHFHATQKLNADSISPIVKAVNRDIIHTIKNLRNVR